MERLDIHHEELHTTNILQYPSSESAGDREYIASEIGDRASTQSPIPDLGSRSNTGTSNPLSKKELNDLLRREKKERNNRAENPRLDETDEARFRECVEDWFIHKRPAQFPTVLFKVLGKLDDERGVWLAKNPNVGSEIIVEAWVSPRPNEYPMYRNTSGIGLWKWLSKPVEGRSDRFTLISLSGLTEDILKALLVHYDIKIQCLYEMVFVDSFIATIHTATENVFALSFDFVRLVPLGDERRNHTQTFMEFENKRRDSILTWKWDPFGSDPDTNDRAYEIARTVVWLRRDPESGKLVAVFYVDAKKCKKIVTKMQAQWRMSEFCDEVNARTRSSRYLPKLGQEDSSEEVFHFLARYMKETFKWNRVLALHQQKVIALENEAFAMPMVETTRDIYRQKAALDIHLAILHLQQTMVSALCSRQVSEKMFWPKDGSLLFGDLQDALGEKIIDLERMRKQCDDIQNLIFNTIAIEESRAAVDQGRSVGRLTWLTFIFLPLSFGASILGMNVFQLNTPGLWLYFALTLPLLLLMTGGIVCLKACVLYSQSGQKELGFLRWLLSGRPMRSAMDRVDLERGTLTRKLKNRLKGPSPKKPRYQEQKGVNGEAKGPVGNKKED